MSDPQKTEILKNYVASAPVMQLATIDGGAPWLCHVWFVLDWPAQRLLFISSLIRNHSKHLDANSKVAAAILNMSLTALGQKVQGVTLTGTARIVGNDELDSALAIFRDRWPAAALDSESIKRNEVPNRLYELQVEKWVLHDEVNFPNQPRYELAAMIMERE